MSAPSDPRQALRRLEGAADEGSRLKELVKRHRLSMVVVFGSVLTENRPAADLDLAVEAPAPLDLLALSGDLYALTGYEDIDVLDLSRAGTVLRAEALGYGRPLFESVPGRFAEAQVTALAMLWETRWLRDLELEMLAG